MSFRGFDIYGIPAEKVVHIWVRNGSRKEQKVQKRSRNRLKTGYKPATGSTFP